MASGGRSAAASDGEVAKVQRHSCEGRSAIGDDEGLKGINKLLESGGGRRREGREWR